jgi:RND family efflux transporter MFP subunit
MNVALKIIVFVALVAVVAFVGRSLLKREEPERLAPRLYTVKRVDIEQSVYGAGVLRCSRRAEIVSRVVGKILAQDVPVEEGDAVQSASLLCTITNDDLQNQLDEATKEYEIREFHYNDSREEYENAKKKHEKFEEPSEKELRRLEVQLQGKQLELHKAKEAVDTLREKIAYLEVKSPLSGIVLKSHLKRSDLKLDPDREYPAGTPLFVVGDLTSLAVYGTILESDRGKVEQGDAVVVQCGKSPLPARVTSLSLVPSAASEGGRYEVHIDFDKPPSGVNEGIAVDFRIIVEKKTGVLAIPVEYVEVEGQRHWVKRVAGKKVQRIPVEVGISSSSLYEVKAGLKEGEVIRWDAEARE